MSLRDHFVLMASYNQWMNSKLYDAASVLPTTELNADKRAFFGSILGTLNHLCVADRIWLKRFSRQHPTHYTELDPIRALPLPTTLNQLLFDNLVDMRAHRVWLDGLIIEWVAALNEDNLQQPLTYTNTKGLTFSKRFSYLLQHFFNHQTHHRGQATTLLSQAGVDVGATDLLALIPNKD